MRRILLFGLVIFASFYLTSCLIIEDQLNLNEDGSGTKVTLVDLSDILNNPMMGMALRENLQEEGSERMDSSFQIIDELAPLNPQWTTEERELVGRVQGRIFVDGEAGEGMFTTSFKFDNLEEIARLNAIMAAANQPESSQGGPEGMAGGLSSAGGIFDTNYDWKKGTMVMNSALAKSYKNPLANDELGEEGMDMMKMMFEDAAFVYTINFPGKVKKVKGFAGHEVDGNSISQVFDFLDLFEDPAVIAPALTGRVKYKK